MAGLTPQEFWDLTPREIVLFIHGYHKRMHQLSELVINCTRAIVASWGGKMRPAKKYEDPLP